MLADWCLGCLFIGAAKRINDLNDFILWDANGRESLGGQLQAWFQIFRHNHVGTSLMKGHLVLIVPHTHAYIHMGKLAPHHEGGFHGAARFVHTDNRRTCPVCAQGAHHMHAARVPVKNRMSLGAPFTDPGHVAINGHIRHHFFRQKFCNEFAHTTKAAYNNVIFQVNNLGLRALKACFCFLFLPPVCHEFA